MMEIEEIIENEDVPEEPEVFYADGTNPEDYVEPEMPKEEQPIDPVDRIVVEVPADWAEIKPFQQKIVLNDDTTMNGYAMLSTATDKLWVYPESTKFSYIDMIQIFTDPEKTDVIESHISPATTEEYRGYTRLSNIDAQPDGKFTICMAKPIT